MGKAIEETWGYEDDGGIALVPIVDGKVNTLGVKSIGHFCEDDIDEEQVAVDLARAKLATAAPRMARLLRHIAECGSDGQHGQILTVLRAAGVIE